MMHIYSSTLKNDLNTTIRDSDLSKQLCDDGQLYEKQSLHANSGKHGNFAIIYPAFEGELWREKPSERRAGPTSKWAPFQPLS